MDLQSTTAAAATAVASSSSSSSGTPAPSSSTTLGANDFLKLLLAQLSNQDPSAPTDPTAMAAQLAQFTQVQQLQSMNSDLDSMLVAQASSAQTQATQFVGKDAVFNTGAVSLTAGQPTTLSALFGGAATSATAVITNSAGAVVRTLQLGPQPSGNVSVSWDGRGDNGLALPSGTYQAAITASNGASPVSVTQRGAALVTGVSFATGAPVLLTAGGAQVSLPNVLEVDQAP